MHVMVNVVCTPPVATGFALAGLTAVEADMTTAPNAIERIVDQQDAGIILVEQTLYDALPGELRARVDRLASPVLVPFPSPAWQGRGLAEQYVLEILRQAVGYRVRAR